MSDLEEGEPLTILVADDAASDRLILESIVTQAGHTAIGVENGQQAVEVFKECKPDIVLLDVIMPVMGGLEAGRELRKITNTDMVPIIYLTSFTDQDTLVECIEAGGDDFVPKPYNRVVLQSKIKSFGRLRRMHKTMAEQKSQIEEHNAHLIQEQNVAKQVFDKIAHNGCLSADFIRHYMSPLAVFNGDVLLAEVGPDGNMLIMLGDFTGHGLPAAIGSLPLASTFYGMARKGFGMLDILRAINQKLHEILPIGFFCCAICVDISFKKQRVRIWNGGLPEAFLYRKAKDEYQMLPSQNLPLGVLSDRDFTGESTRLTLEEGDQLYMWSDGVFEARNQQGEMFGEQRLHQLMLDKKGKPELFDGILEGVQNHIGISEKDDDLSLVQIEIRDVDMAQYAESNGESAMRGNLGDWKMSFTLGSNSLKDFDPLPLLLNIVDEVPNLRRHRSHLYTILSELYANALEHGVLGLSSSLKAGKGGFARYYEERQKRLANLDSGEVTFDISHEGAASGGVLRMTVKDSGDGFAFDSDAIRKKFEVEKQAQDDISRDYFGRGLTLLQSLCAELTIHPPGNAISVVYTWESE